MESTEIFTKALGLEEPWYVERVEFDGEDREVKKLNIRINFRKGYRFSIDGSPAQTAYDTEEKKWRHLNFFQHECYITARVPRIKAGEHGIKLVQVPWAREGSGFTMLFEAYAMLLIEKEMPVADTAETINVTQPRLWRLFAYWVMRAVGALDLSTVSRVGMDETSYKKGRRYITQFVDLDTRRTIYVVEGKGSDTVGKFVEFLEQHGGKRENIKLVSMDMSSAYISGCNKELPAAVQVYDRFHVVKGCNEALDEVRKSCSQRHPFSAYERYTLLMRNENLDLGRTLTLSDLTEECYEIGQAYMLKDSFVSLYDITFPEEAEGGLAYWCDMAEDSQLKPFVKFATTIKSHWDGIVAFFRHGRQTNGLLEGINSKIQLARRRARGFSNLDNLIHMIYLVSGRLNLAYPPKTL